VGAPLQAPGEGRGPSDLAALTAALCAIPSPTGQEDAIAAWIGDFLVPLPVQVQRVGRTLVARGPARGRPLVLLVGHTDTVRPQAGQGPGADGRCPVERQGDRLVALGASDMKAGVALMLALLADLPLEALPWDLGMVFYDAEEGPYAQSGLGPTLDALPWLSEAALAICLEPSDNAVQVGCMGALHARVRFTGRAAHSARPWEGDNAIHQAGPLLERLRSRGSRDVEIGGLLWREVTSATLARGGEQRNRVPDRFELNLNHRFAPDRSLEEAMADVRALVGPEAELSFEDLCPAGRVVRDNPLLRRFLALSGAPAQPKQAWTDVARLGERGIDAVNCGPGASAQAHQAGEWVDLRAVEAGHALFRRFLLGD
jgi:succinyl-diaminopimelate desuccinylase